MRPTKAAAGHSRKHKVVFRTTSATSVYPGNPKEEWLWYKHCRRKGRLFSLPETGVLLLREVNVFEARDSPSRQPAHLHQ